MKRSRGSGVSGNGNGVRPMLGNVSRQDLDRLFDDPSHPVIPLRGVLAPPTGEAATLFGDDELVTDFEDDEVASLFEESTSDSVPNALVPSRLKPCRKVIISPTSRKALGPVSRPSRSRRWPQLKPVLSSKPAPAAAPVVNEPEVDPEDSPTIPSLPKLPRIIESRPLAVPVLISKSQPVGDAPCPEPIPQVEPEELDTQQDLPLIPRPTPKELPKNADVLAPEPIPVPEPRPVAAAIAPQPEPAGDAVAPQPEPVEDAIATRPEPEAVKPRPVLMPVALEPDPTLQVVMRPRKRKVSPAVALGTFVAGVAVTSLLFLALVPWNQPEKVIIKTTQPDQAMRPLATPLAEPREMAPAPAPVAPTPRASKEIAPAPAAIPYPGAVPLPEPPDTAANRAGIKVAQTIKPCLSGRALFYQRIGVRINSWGAVWKGLIDAKWGADEAAQKCVKQKLDGLRLPKLPTGRYVEWHITLQGDSPRAWVTYPRELKVR